MGKLQRLAEDFSHLADEDLTELGGKITEISTQSVKVKGLSQYVGAGSVMFRNGQPFGETVNVCHTDALVIPYQSTRDLRIGSILYPGQLDTQRISDNWLGRVFDALGNPIDEQHIPLRGDDDNFDGGTATKVTALMRGAVDQPLQTGVRAMDIFTPLCYGQRLGIFAGSGVGKSTLLSMLTRSDAFDVVVVALVGERSREAREFLNSTIDQKTQDKTVTIVATGDESPLLRKRTPELAMSVGQYFSAKGKSVLLLIDSVTRYAHALREIGISAGEPPVARGYPPSVFSQLPVLLERAGPGAVGTGNITLLATVLIDGDDHNDPVADCIRGITDGHVVLEREIAEAGRYPAIDPLKSISRLSNKVWTPDQRELVMQLSKLIFRFEDSKDIRLIGGYRQGQDLELDQAIDIVPVVYGVLNQPLDDDIKGDVFDYLAAQIKKSQSIKMEKINER